MRLTPIPEVAAGMIRLEKEWYASNVGWFHGPTLTDALEYRETLKKHIGEAVDCDQSYRHFNEAIYPIDCSREVLAQVCTDEFSESFADYFEDKKWPFAQLGDFSRAELYVLGANSD